MISSHELFIKAKQFIPGGVNSPARSFNAVGGEPIFFSHGKGAYLFDVQNKAYIDYVGSWGALVLGHAHEKIVSAVEQAAQRGLSFGAPTSVEIDLAEKISNLMPNLTKVRLMNSGTEATMTAIRLARGFTGRDKILKFNGCYHGHVDALLVKAGSGLANFSLPDCAGVPKDVVHQTLSVDFNNLEQVTQMFMQHGKEIAAVIVEPIAANMNCILPLSGFLEGLRELCDYYGSLLVFDEVISGFRVSLGGAQEIYQVKPDLTTLGKIIGGGLPVGALGGRAEVMDCLAPLGNVYQAGTLSGNPITVAAGLATLEIISQPEFYAELNFISEKLVSGLLELAKDNSISFQAHHIGGLFGFLFTKEAEIYNYQQVKLANQSLFKEFFHRMLAEGIYLSPSSFEAGFISSSHGEQEIDFTLTAAEKIFAKLKEQDLITA
jgi:glutamate-1-semialdehyde 2,1-aminomutase